MVQTRPMTALNAAFGPASFACAQIDVCEGEQMKTMLFRIIFRTPTSEKREACPSAKSTTGVPYGPCARGREVR